MAGHVRLHRYRRCGHRRCRGRPCETRVPRGTRTGRPRGRLPTGRVPASFVQQPHAVDDSAGRRGPHGRHGSNPTVDADTGSTPLSAGSRVGRHSAAAPATWNGRATIATRNRTDRPKHHTTPRPFLERRRFFARESGGSPAPTGAGIGHTREREARGVRWRESTGSQAKRRRAAAGGPPRMRARGPNRPNAHPKCRRRGPGRARPAARRSRQR